MYNDMEETIHEIKEEEGLRSRKMRTTPVGKLLFRMSMPAIMSMLVQALYNVVDSIFISWDSAKGLDALGIAFPLQTLIVAFAVGIGVGANAQIAKKLGEGRNDEASATARNALFMAATAALVFVALAFTVSRPFMSLFSSDAQTIDMGTQYLTIVMGLSFGTFLEITLSKTLQATGNMIVPMVSQLIGAVTNIVLDPVFIFAFDMGVAGAAIATVIGQICSFIFVTTVFITRKQDVSLRFRGFRPQWRYIKAIFIIGLPTIVMNSVSSFTTMAMNAIVRPLSENAIRILSSVYFKLQSFVFMPVFGLTQGALPILSYNYGSDDDKRYKRAAKLTVMVALCIMAVGTVLFQTCTPLLLKIFNASGTFMSEGIYALRIISISFVFAAFGITVTTIFQSLGRGVSSLIMSLMRQVVLLLPFALLLASVSGIWGVWFCYPISEFIVCAVFTPLSVRAIGKSFMAKRSDKPAAATDEAVG